MLCRKFRCCIRSFRLLPLPKMKKNDNMASDPDRTAEINDGKCSYVRKDNGRLHIKWQRFAPLPEGFDPHIVPGCVLEGILGAGGMGTVYLGRQVTLNRQVAVKILNRDLANQAKFIDRLRKEAQIMGGMSHPNLVGCHDIIISSNNTCLVMDYIPGHLNGKNVVKLLGVMPEHYVVKTLLNLTRGLAYAYEQGYTHRDVKPENILFAYSRNRAPRYYEEIFHSADSRAALCDFGIADAISTIAPNGTATTANEATAPSSAAAPAKEENDKETTPVVGSPLYMAPEQAINPESVDCRTDIYSLACSAFFLLTGTPPFNGKDWDEVLDQKVDNNMPAPKAGKFSPQLLRIIQKMGALAPEQRYQDYPSLLKDLEELDLLYSDRNQSMRAFMYGHHRAIMGTSLAIISAMVLALAGIHWYTLRMLRYTPAVISQNLDISCWKGSTATWRQIVDTKSGAVMLSGNRHAKPLILKDGVELGDVLYIALRLPDSAGSFSLELRTEDSDEVLGYVSCRRQNGKYRVNMLSAGSGTDHSSALAVPMPFDFPDQESGLLELKVHFMESSYFLCNDNMLMGVGHYTHCSQGTHLQVRLIPSNCDGFIVEKVRLMKASQNKNRPSQTPHHPVRF